MADAHLVQLDRSAVGVVAGVRGQYQVRRVVSKGQMHRAAGLPRVLVHVEQSPGLGVLNLVDNNAYAQGVPVECR